MTVDQLREALAQMPGHWPVHVAIPQSDDPFSDLGYHYTLECLPEAFPSLGNMAVIHLNQEPT